MDHTRPTPTDEVTELRALLGAALERIDRLERGRHERGPSSTPVAVPVPVPVAVSTPAPVVDADRRVGRRQALKGAALAAGATAAGLVLGDAQPAAAANGNNLVLGSVNQTATSATGVAIGGTAATYGFAIVDNGRSAPPFKPAITGHAGKHNFDVAVEARGDDGAIGLFADSGSHHAVHAESYDANSYAIYATSMNGTGAFIESTEGPVGLYVSGNQGYGIFTSTVEAAGVHANSSVGAGVEASSASGPGVTGSSTANTGVVGTSAASAGIGVEGTVTGSSGNSRGVHGVATAGKGVQGAATTGTGVHGVATTGTGVYAESTSSFGAEAYSASGTGLKARGKVFGVIAQSLSAASTDAALAASALQAMAIYATTDDGLVLSGQSANGGGIEVKAPKFHLRLGNEATRGAPTSDSFAHLGGEVVYTTAGEHWLCVKGGTPGTWRKVAGQATAGSFHVLAAPVRVYDSRSGTAPSTGPKTPLAPNVARTIDLKGSSSGVPAGATAALVTVLLLNTASGNGNFTLWAGGVAKPSANTMVWGGAAGGRYTAKEVSALDAAARIQVSSSLKADIALDVVGYYR